MPKIEIDEKTGSPIVLPNPSHDETANGPEGHKHGTVAESFVIPDGEKAARPIVSELVGVDKRIEDARLFNQSLGVKSKVQAITIPTPVKLTKSQKIALVLKNHGMDSMQQSKAMHEIESIINETDELIKVGITETDTAQQLRERISNILRKHGGLESNIPHDDDYWKLTGQYRALMNP